MFSPIFPFANHSLLLFIIFIFDPSMKQLLFLIWQAKNENNYFLLLIQRIEKMHLDLEADAEMATITKTMVEKGAKMIADADETTTTFQGEKGIIIPSGEKDDNKNVAPPMARSPSFLMADPFLALQNDLDDVSEVIKHNLVADEHLLMSTGNSPSQEADGHSHSLSAKFEMEMSSPQQSRDGSLPREFMEEDPSKQRQIGHILHLLQQPENANNNNHQQQQQPISQSVSNFDQHFDLSPMAAATTSPNSLLRYTFTGVGQQSADPMIGGGGGPSSISPETIQGRMHFDGQGEMMGMCTSPLQAQQQQIDQHTLNFPQYSQIDEQQQNWQSTKIGQPHFRPQMPIIEDKSPPPVEPNFSGEMLGGGIKQEMLLTMEQRQQTRGYGGPPENEAVATKNQLIRMLLEMSPQELEHLRASRNHQRIASSTSFHQQAPFHAPAPHHHHHQQQPLSQPIFIQTVPQHPPPQMFLQPQQNSPPLDPPPPNNIIGHQQFQMDNNCILQGPPHQYGGGQFTEYPIGPMRMQIQSSAGAHFYPSPTGSTALTSPISNDGFPSLAPSEFLEEESAMEEIWTDGEILGGANYGENDDEGEEEIGMPNANGHKGQGERKRAHKTERRTAHNLIEKKYRCSINDRIKQLKEMLAAEEQQKLSKSATLRRAVDHILSLRSKNSELANENVRLRQTLEMAGIAAPPTTARLPSPVQQRAAMRVGKQQQQQNEPHSANKNPRPRGRLISTKKGTAATISGGPPRDQSRVTLCVFMFLLLVFNPLSMFFAHSGNALDQQEDQQHFGANHRTLVAADDKYNDQFDGQDPALIQQSPHLNRPLAAEKSSNNFWWSSSPPWFRQCFIWMLNSLFVFAILNRLLVSGEPVADRRSPRWSAFLETRRKAGQAVAAGNWKEAQRELDESLQLLERQLPSSGGADEWMSLTWQIIRHLLNVLWIGRWFARRRRPSVKSQKWVCRSHAAAAMVYHQLHQLHLLGVDGIGLTQRGALNLALLAANLAESAGASAISHALRAEIYACAGIRCRLCIPKWMRRIISGYFFRRAKRHVSKSQRLEGTQMNSLQWLFHPLARRFLADPQRIGEILRETGAQKTPNFPFSNSAQSPKPIEVLRDSFKIHLLNGLLAMVDSSEGNFRVADFVEQSQLLLQICSADVGWNGAGWNNYSGSEEEEEEEGEKEAEIANGNKLEEQALFDLLSPTGSQGDEFCYWWANLLSGALHWRHGDLARARQHCAVVRKCPKELGQNDLALAVGLAFCSRKICLEDRRKGAWAEMVLLHTQRAFAHLQKADRHCQWREGEQNWQSTLEIQRHFRLISCQWLLSSLLDLCSFSIGPGQEVPLEVRRLYSGIMIRMEAEGVDGVEPKKLAMFRHLGQTLCGIIFVENATDDSLLRDERFSSSPAPSSVGSSSNNLGLPSSSQQRKNTIEMLRAEK